MNGAVRLEFLPCKKRICRTFTPSISLHKLISRARFREVFGKEGELREDFVDEANFGSKLVLVDVEC